MKQLGGTGKVLITLKMLLALAIFVLLGCPEQSQTNNENKKTAQNKNSVTVKNSNQAQNKSPQPTNATSFNSRRNENSLRLSGAFIQLDETTEQVSEQDWEKILDQMKAAGMNTVIIQYVRFKNGNDDFNFLEHTKNGKQIGNGVDHVGKILEYAEKTAKMKVFIGLWFDSEWWTKADPLDAVYFKKDGTFETGFINTINEVWKRYGEANKYPNAFAGWYLPQETWNMPYNDTQAGILRDSFSRVTSYCKFNKGNKPVAFSPYLSSYYLNNGGTTKAVERVYSILLTGSGIDIVAMQDSVGARTWDEKWMIDGRVPDYLKALGNACSNATKANKANGQNEVVLWGNLEAFVQVQGGDRGGTEDDRKPACIQRFGWQIEAANTVPAVKKLITFDFFHYMNSITKNNNSYPLCERERLYGNYVKNFVPENSAYKDFMPKSDCLSELERYCYPPVEP